MIAAPNSSIMKNVCNLVPSQLLTNSELDPMIQDLSEEINHDYEFSVRKSIGKFSQDKSHSHVVLHVIRSRF